MKTWFQTRSDKAFLRVPLWIGSATQKKNLVYQTFWFNGSLYLGRWEGVQQEGAGERRRIFQVGFTLGSVQV